MVAIFMVSISKDYSLNLCFSVVRKKLLQLTCNGLVDDAVWNIFLFLSTWLILPVIYACLKD